MKMARFDASRALEALGQHADQGFQTEDLFGQPTQYLHRLHAHATRLAPTAGDDTHADAYDAAILVLTGTAETLDQQVGPNSAIFPRRESPTA